MTESAPVVDLPFATGNGSATVTGHGVVVDRDLRDSTGDRWYWHVRLRGRGPVRLRTARPGLVGGFGPAISRDSGRTYSWLHDRYSIRRGFELDLCERSEALVAPTLPYGPDQLRSFLRRHRDDLPVERLTRSEGGRDIPLVRLAAERRPRRRIVVTARHHACEAVGSLLFEAILGSVLDLRRDGVGWTLDTEIVAVPFVDVDGVVRGDQGKARLPHDHNRDYGDDCRYAGVRALRCASLFDGLPCVALDLHTPGLAGPLEERPFLVASGDDGDDRRVAALAGAISGSFAGRPEVMVFDEEWNSARSSGPRGFAAWARSHRTVVLATSVEYPNAVVRGSPVTSDVVRSFGRHLVMALEQVFS